VDKNYLIFEYMSRGSMLDFLREEGKNLTEKNFLNLGIGVAKGMAYVDSRNIIHKDLSARNVLVAVVDGKYIAKISDFGLSRQTDTGYYKVINSKIPIKWTAPEVLEGKACSTKSDVWSFGVCMWEIYSLGKEPYNWLNNKEVTEQVPKGLRLDKPENCSDDVWTIVKDCWLPEPEDRPRFKRIVEKLQLTKKQKFGKQLSHSNSNTSDLVSTHNGGYEAIRVPGETPYQNSPMANDDTSKTPEESPYNKATLEEDKKASYYESPLKKNSLPESPVDKIPLDEESSQTESSSEEDSPHNKSPLEDSLYNKSPLGADLS